MNWQKDLEEKEKELAEVKAMLSKYRKLEKELKKDIEGIKNIMILESHWEK